MIHLKNLQKLSLLEFPQSEIDRMQSDLIQVENLFESILDVRFENPLPSNKSQLPENPHFDYSPEWCKAEIIFSPKD